MRGESVFLSKTNDGGAGLSHQPSDQASPDEVAELRDSIRKGLDLLEDEPLRQIAIARMRGLANQEIAEQQNLTVRSVERKLALIRDLWKEGLGR